MENTLYIYGDIATRSGVVVQLKLKDKWKEPYYGVGKVPEITQLLTNDLDDYLYTHNLKRTNENRYKDLIIKFVTYNVPYMRANPTVSNLLSFYKGFYAGLVQGYTGMPVESYTENEKTVSKLILGFGNYKRKEKKVLTKKLMNETDEDLADAKMLMTYCQKTNQY